MDNFYQNQTITITYGDQAENHAGMQKIGKMAPSGFTVDELDKAKILFENKGYEVELIDLSELIKKDHPSVEDATILVVRKGVNCILEKEEKTVDDLFLEQTKLKPDKKAKMYGRVVNKQARYNLCFGTRAQKPDFGLGKGSIVAFRSVPLTKAVRDGLAEYLGDKAKNLCAEGNYYYDATKCGIGYHGDTERRRVVGVRLGQTLPICYQWYKNNERVGKKKTIMLNHGDLYVMSEKTVGTDWKTRSKLTLRHAAGCDKYTK